METMPVSMTAIALRLLPQQDLKAELGALAIAQELEAACIITCVGSLTRAVLRLAGQSEPTQYDGRFEIVSLVGLLSRHGSHFHMAIADNTGHTFGGHVLAGCQVYTTAEIVIGVMSHTCFRRELDPATGYRELAIEPL
ncbi:MAG: DNA-binding protein [Elainellaceae cyanobacterium]